jgi:hypothetical protein
MYPALRSKSALFALALSLFAAKLTSLGSEGSQPPANPSPALEQAAVPTRAESPLPVSVISTSVNPTPLGG